MKKTIAILLSCIMLLACVPFTASAADVTWNAVETKTIPETINAGTTVMVTGTYTVATTLTVQHAESKIAIDLTKEWEKIGDGSALMMGCVVVRNEYLKDNKETVEKFLEEYKASIDAANSDLDGTAALCEQYGIVAKAAIAKKAIPNCNLCFIKGEEMKTKLSGYLTVLHNADKTAVGGKLPADDFYYAG